MYSRKKLIILLSTLLMVILMGAIFGITSFKPKYAYTTARLNFRSYPNTNNNPIKILPKNEHLKIVGSSENYYMVQLETNEVGYVYKSYLTITTNKPGTKTYYSNTPYTASIKYDVVNVRRGPSTSYSKIAKVYKNDKVTVIGRIDDFLTVILNDNKIGMIRQDLLVKTTTTNTSPPTTSTTSNEDVIINLINNERTSKNISKLIKDSKLMEISKLKSNEMVSRDYFLHTSPTYGTPFNMMKNFGITYLVAGENIAGNSDLKKAIENWMNSETHSQNILSNSYNYIGCGVTKSDKYGYVISVMFIGK